MANFHHLPIWSEEPMDQSVMEGEDLELNCSAVVGPQYNSIKLKPVRALWKNAHGRLVDSDSVKTLQDVSNDEMIYGVKLTFRSATKNQAGKYTCFISNHYGMLSKSINVSIGT